MIVDLRELASGTVLDTGVCVIGGGAAGITLARAFAARGVRSSVLESGGAVLDERVQSLFETEQIGLPDAMSCRLRFLGGATNHWGGLCAPLNELDFALRAWVPHSGWPIGFGDLYPYYKEAQAVCGLGPYAYDAETLGMEISPQRAFSSAKLATRFYQFSSPPLKFAAAYRDELARATEVTVYLNANVTSLAANEHADTVLSAEIRTVDGWHGRAQADIFVLACGGIENARLLLLSNAVQSAGLGNDSDRVGRFFMQHPHLSDTELLVSDPEALQRAFKKFQAHETLAQISIGPSVQAQRRRRTLNCSATIQALADPESGVAAAQGLWRELRRGRWPDDLADKLWTIITDVDSIFSRAYRGPVTATVHLRSEQAPNPDSRVTLGERRDRLGQRVAQVEWRLGTLDKRTLRVSALLIGEELGRLGLGRIRLPLWLVDDESSWPDLLWGGCHHMGTTRMSVNPRLGIVDRDCRVHSVNNLYIAGSSVFPTSGYANPTLTIVALALRLADHIAGLVERRGPMKRGTGTAPGASAVGSETRRLSATPAGKARLRGGRVARETGGAA